MRSTATRDATILIAVLVAFLIRFTWGLMVDASEGLQRIASAGEYAGE